MERQNYREQIHNELRKYMRIYFIRLRNKMNLTKEQMAELLLMDTRTYADKENGSELCNLVTFVALLEICQDEDALLNDISMIYSKVISDEEKN